MSFNERSTLDTSQAQSGGGGGRLSGGVLPIGGGVGGIAVVIVIFVIKALLGGADTTLPGITDGAGGASGPAPDLSVCKTGADANRYEQCRIVGTANSVQAYWATALPKYGKRYTDATIVIYSGQAQSACGTASNDVGPFYCPLDKKVYIDPSFYQELTDRFGASSGALAQEYVVAHEYGHHIQDILGLLGRAQQDPQGATSGSVRTELMADCLAGVWANHASTTNRRRRRAVPAAPVQGGHHGRALGCGGGRRRPHPAAGDRPRDTGHLDPRLLGPAAALVHDGLPERRPEPLRHLLGEVPVDVPVEPAHAAYDTIGR